MTAARFGLAAALAALPPTLVLAGEARPGVDWPSFRGPVASGVADGKPTGFVLDFGNRQNTYRRVAE